MVWIVAKDDFCSKPSTNSVFARKRDSTDSFQNRAFACRLIATDNQLRKRDVIPNPVGSNPVNLIEPFRCPG
jgi:hypothetical protein